jgi:prepilin-type N-terminal cleavage/methylation domain-containing protein
MFRSSVRRAFTLIELLIVVAIIAILAAIAVPNFLEAQVRSKVSRAVSDMRAIATGLEAYSIDNNGYPWQNTSSRSLNPPSQGNNPAGGFAPTLERLSTPVAYLAGGSIFTDPFFAQNTYQGVTLETVAPITGFSALDRQSFESYWYMARKINASNWGDPPTEKPEWWLLSSAGPDRFQHNAGTFFNSAPVGLLRTESAIGLTQKMIYDPTNGTVSRGSIWRQGGVPRGTGQAFGIALQRHGK